MPEVLPKLLREKRFRGFTLVELIIVIAVVGGLAGIFATVYPASQKRARDSERKSDLKQYQTSLETFANRSNGLYPDSDGNTVPLASICDDLGTPDCPDDPKSGQYFYQSNADGTAYIVWSSLETDGNLWAVCSNGQTGYLAALPTLGDCPIGVPPTDPLPTSPPTPTSGAFTPTPTLASTPTPTTSGPTPTPCSGSGCPTSTPSPIGGGSCECGKNPSSGAICGVCPLPQVCVSNQCQAASANAGQNVLINSDFSNGLNGWISTNPCIDVHDPRSCSTYPNAHLMQFDWDPPTSHGCPIGTEAWLRQTVSVSQSHSSLFFGMTEAHHMYEGVAEINIYGRVGNGPWELVFNRPGVESPAGAGKCNFMPAATFEYTIPVSKSYDQYQLEIHGHLINSGDGFLFGPFFLYPVSGSSFIWEGMKNLSGILGQKAQTGYLQLLLNKVMLLFAR